MNTVKVDTRKKGFASAVACAVAVALACLLTCMVAPAGQADAKTIYSTAPTADAKATSNAKAKKTTTPRVGTVFTLGNNTYKITDRYEGPRDLGEVMLVKYGSNGPHPVFNILTYQGKKYKVETIGANAFNNPKGHRITTLKLGPCVEKIGARAFYGCTKLRTIDIARSDVVDVDYNRRTGRYYLDEAEIGWQAFSKAGVSKVTVKCGNANASYRAAVKKAFVAKGLSANCRVIR